MAKAWPINEDGGAPEYNAQELRRISGAWLWPGVSDRFGARSGVRPTAGDVVTVSGSTWTVHDCQAVVYPGISSVSGPYVVELGEDSDSLNPADGSNDRIDALDLQVRDDDEDASGERDVRVVYVPGTPASSPAAPSLTANSLRLATILVPSGGSPDPSVETLAAFTVASGGVLPVRDSGELPSAGRYHGLLAYRQDSDELQVWDGSAWVGVAGAEVSERGRVYARLIQDTAQPISDSGQTFMEWHDSTILVDGGWSASPNPTRFVPPLPGLWRFDAVIGWAGSSSGSFRECSWAKNGSSIAGGMVRHTPNSSAQGFTAAPMVVEMNGTTDYIELRAAQDGSAPINTFVGTIRSVLTATYAGLAP